MKRKLLFISLCLFIGVALWGQPKQIFYEDFEGYVGFEMAAGDWTVLNKDVMDYDYAGFSGVTFKDRENLPIKRMSFMVMDYSEIDQEKSSETIYSYEAHSKNKAMVSTVPWSMMGLSGSASESPANTWLISPKIDKLEQSNNVLVFYIRSQNILAPKARFKVYVSEAQQGEPKKMGENNFDESRFTLISRDPEILTDYMEEEPDSRWIKFVYPLDEYIGKEIYIAIQNVSQCKDGTSIIGGYESYGFMVDDVEIIQNACMEEIRGIFSLGINEGEAVVQWSGDADWYDIEYGPEGFELGKGTRQTVSATEYTISGLDENKVYHYYVRSYCGENNPSEIWSRYHELKKMQLPVEITPENTYSYVFETADLELDGWKIETLSPEQGEWRLMPLGNSFSYQAYENQGFMKFDPLMKTNGVESDSWLISRGLQLIEGQEIVVSFHMAAPFGKENFKVAVSTGNSAQALSEGKVLFHKKDIDNGKYEPFTVRFTAEENGIYFLGFCACSSRSTSQIWFDYVTVTDSSAYLEDEEYEVLLEDDFDEGYTDYETGNIGKLVSINASDKEKIVGEELGEGLSKASFMVVGGETLTKDNYNFTGYSADKSLIVFASKEGVSDDWLITEKLNLGNSGNIVSFWAKAPHKEANNEKFRILISSEEFNIDDFNADNFELLGEEVIEIKDYLQKGYENNWIPFSFSLDKYARQYIYIALNYISSNEENGSALMIDDLRVVQGGWMDSTIDIQILETGITDTSAQIEWTSYGAYGYEIEYGERGFQLGEGTRNYISDKSYSISELEANSVYDVYVRSWLNEEVAAENWVGPVDFRTRVPSLKIEGEYEFATDFEEIDFKDYGWRGSTENITCWKSVLDDAENAYEGTGYMMYENKSTKEDLNDFLFIQPLITKGYKKVDISFYYKTTTPEAKLDLYVISSWANSYGGILLAETSPVTIIDILEELSNAEYKHFEISGNLNEPDIELPIYFGLVAIPRVDDAEAKIYVDNFVIRFENAQGIDGEDYEKESLVVYPNPAQDIITVVYPSYINTDVAQVIIRDMSGKQVKSEACQSFINVSQLSSGVYSITVTDGINKESKMFIKR